MTPIDYANEQGWKKVDYRIRDLTNGGVEELLNVDPFEIANKGYSWSIEHEVQEDGSVMFSGQFTTMAHFIFSSDEYKCNPPGHGKFEVIMSES
ncbi:hypothetical protein [Cohnella fermenti]|uniref:Uncharacterized protein n=1 Tax=Cohnella fermenti TaxID=2565925 RepID=A0A4S4C719_9BACL|nr:hypothetical protein [Cohnella fermenti]THF83729.1 hypothetical protein E6C55_03300 [Cohnella fermenti]